MELNSIPTAWTHRFATNLLCAKAMRTVTLWQDKARVRLLAFWV